MYIRRILIAAIIAISMVSSSAYAEWHFGIGTGPSILKIDGDIGFHTNIAGPVKMNVDADPDDIMDVMDSALGLSGYASNGKWTFKAAYANLVLEGSGGNRAAHLDIEADLTGAEFAVGYALYEKPYLNLNLIGGIRYTEHEISVDFSTERSQLNRTIDNDWTDAVIGLSANVPLTHTLTWNTQMDFGFGGSEGTYTANTGLTWQFYKGWSGTLFCKYAAVDFENAARGSQDWYLYDMNEQSLGLAIFYNW
ncbi:hypothetical protein [Desulfobacter sp. UBA2225]|uniref:hypothetical protein n=1 Tax=Desulfobacter sp. UBA2225 TaxID=1961413 RepID=UPI00257DAD6B|nr:hypothetical protein [Desulfobacter sp. UBA2225]